MRLLGKPISLTTIKKMFLTEYTLVSVSLVLIVVSQ